MVLIIWQSYVSKYCSGNSFPFYTYIHTNLIIFYQQVQDHHRPRLCAAVPPRGVGAVCSARRHQAEQHHAGFLAGRQHHVRLIVSVAYKPADAVLL